MSGVIAPLLDAALTQSLAHEALHTSSIEGVYLNREDIMSSIMMNLGLQYPYRVIHDLRTKGVTELIVAIQRDVKKPMTAELLCGWHQLLLSYRTDINVGTWRSSSNTNLGY